MKINHADGDTVELNQAEQHTKERLDFYVTVFNTPKADAVEEALKEHRGTPSKEFVEWLSDGALTKSDGEVVSV